MKKMIISLFLVINLTLIGVTFVYASTNEPSSDPVAVTSHVTKASSLPLLS